MKISDDALLSINLALFQLDAAGEDVSVWLTPEGPMLTYEVKATREDLVSYAMTHSRCEGFVR